MLVLGGTRYFGVHLVTALIKYGYEVTIATRGKAHDSFTSQVKRKYLDRYDSDSIRNAILGTRYDVVYDNLAYASNDVKCLMDSLTCEKYVMVSSAAVYRQKKINTIESDFSPEMEKLKWCNRGDFSYDETKRQAECALFQKYTGQESIAVRYPFVIGEDDYTGRLLFYVEHVIKGLPMNIDNLNQKLGFIQSNEAGDFLAHLSLVKSNGPINGCSKGIISVGEIIKYIEQKCNAKAVCNSNGDAAPYNGESEYSLNTDKAERTGYIFSCLEDWIYELLDFYIKRVKKLN